MLEGVKDFFDGMIHGREMNQYMTVPERPDNVPNEYVWDFTTGKWIKTSEETLIEQRNEMMQAYQAIVRICNECGQNGYYEDNLVRLISDYRVAKVFIRTAEGWHLVYDCSPGWYWERVYEKGDWVEHLAELV